MQQQLEDLGLQPLDPVELCVEGEDTLSCHTLALQKSAVVLGDWMISHGVSMTAMTELLGTVLPGCSSIGGVIQLADLPAEAKGAMKTMGCALQQYQVAGDSTVD